MNTTLPTGTLILGVGNTLLGDEGAGVHALDLLAARLGEQPGVTLLDGGTLSFTLLPRLEDAERLIVFDAARLDAPAGTVRCFEGPEMDEFIGRPNCSVHEVGLVDLMNMSRLSGRFPRHRALIGIQPEFVGWRDSPSAPVAAALEKAADCALALLQDWNGTAVHPRNPVSTDRRNADVLA